MQTSITSTDRKTRPTAKARHWLGAAALLALSGCSSRLLNPQGDIGVQEKQLILIATDIMLAVVIPVIALTLYFSWHYRASNTKAVYAPTWSHSNRIEVVIWTIPCIIVAFLGILIWNTTHSLDPYQPLPSKTRPVRVEVVALNWKWLFIYPDYGVATVNQLQLPVDTPVDFTLTAESLMNSFFIPQLGSQVYAMAGMQTQLHLIANHTGSYNGMSSAFSGSGFSDMHFNAVVTNRQDFDNWVAHARNAPLKLDQARYAMLERPSDHQPVITYADADPALFSRIVNKYVRTAPGGVMADADICKPATTVAMHSTTKPEE